MVTDVTVVKKRRRPLQGFEEATERVLGVDMRLLYGLGAPVVTMSVVIALLLGFAASPWAVAGLLVIEAAVLGVVLLGFVGMLNEDDETDVD